MNPDEKRQFEEVVKLTRENNRMLRSMRRNAWLGGIIKLLMYAAFLVIPLYLYMQFVAPMVDGMMQTMEQISGTSAQAQAQFGALQEYMDKLKSFGL